MIRFLEFQPFDSLVRTETLMDLGCAERLHKFLSLVGSAGDVGLMDCSWLKLPVGRDPNPWTHTNSLFLRHMTSRTVCDQEYLQILVEGRRFSPRNDAIFKWLGGLWNDAIFPLWVFCCLRSSRWWFQPFFICTPTWGNDPIWLIFPDGLKRPKVSTVSTGPSFLTWTEPQYKQFFPESTWQIRR